MTDDEALTLRVTVIDGERCANDYQVIWRGMSIGRIRRTSDVSGAPQWVWNCYVNGRPCRADESGDAKSLDDAKVRFRTVWEGLRAGLSEMTSPERSGTTEASAEALARYARKAAELGWPRGRVWSGSAKRLGSPNRHLIVLGKASA